jgi:hypothetical protein
MVERLLLYGVNTESGSPAITGQNHTLFTGLADKAKAALARSQFTTTRTQVTLKPAIFQPMPPFSLDHSRLDHRSI